MQVGTWGHLRPSARGRESGHPAPWPSQLRQRRSLRRPPPPGGGSSGGGGEPETAKTKSDQPAEKVSPAAATTTPNPPAGAATFESETYQLEVSRGGKGRGD